MSDRNEMLDICDMTGEGKNLWFVAALLGAIGLNLVLTCVLAVCVLRGGRARGGGKDKGDFEDVQTSVLPSKHTGGGGGGNDGGGGDMKKELLLFKRQLESMERKIENKRVNEITASYLLHNAHDAIGNHVPTAAQVTLDQIGSHQYFIKQRVEDMDKRMQQIEASISRILATVTSR
eukprot:CAMPEP_0179410078 /NCGR_PEP_ID=MMETSP0799-20121207/3073_1 /TAXON_ID=46947 /ORGANISM="Geminigera cryophila, Strain CCMP2564" /LENGTH=176 /DNA_ID=CAMNT_0021181859 /DNA_START=108 /DNA_END=638 /DNA_ORIENTATION=-